MPNGSSETASMSVEHKPTPKSNGVSVIKTRSVEETEAAHDLLSLSQSLPPLPAPGAVTIPKCEDLNSLSYSYSPLSPETATSPQTSLPLSLPCYPTPILYVVQVPTIPTPPTSECSSDAENQLQNFSIQAVTEKPDDIFILPLSPEPEGRGNESAMLPCCEQASKTSVARKESVITATELNIPDRRMRKSSRCSKNSKNTHRAHDQANGNAKKHKTVIAVFTKCYKLNAGWLTRAG